MSDVETRDKARKDAVRQASLARRDGLSETYRIEAALDVVDHLENITFETGTIIGGFWPIRSEMDTRPTLDALRERGAHLALPAVINPTTIVFRELVRGGDMVPAGFGTMAPPENALVLMPSILLMPLSAIDRAGNRCGYGAGHYDRYIENQTASGNDMKLIGLAFDVQIVDDVPTENHDVPLHGLITESGYTEFER